LTGCLSLFLRPCGFSFSSPGAWHYFFGDQDPQENTEDIIAISGH
jgi:predicted metal-binding protein